MLKPPNVIDDCVFFIVDENNKSGKLFSIAEELHIFANLICVIVFIRVFDMINHNIKTRGKVCAPHSI